MQHLLSDFDLSAEEILDIIKLAEKIKSNPSEFSKALENKSLGMIFEKTSTRTRVSFEAAMTQLGGHAIYLDTRTTQLSKGESIADTTKVLSRYCDAIMARLYRQADLEVMAKAASVPVINGLTDLFHPCQILGDLLTVKEKIGLNGKLAFIGDCGFNIAHSILVSFSRIGMDVNLVCPKNENYMPNQDILKKAKEQAVGIINVIHDPVEGIRNADIVYTDTWVSMGQEAEKEQRIRDLKPYQVNQGLLRHAEKALIMHCLPADRGREITDDVLDGPKSIVLDQAENRMHIQKAILVKLIGND
ncbi:MAG: ornithine carbamoyltransferase [Candidatus Aenigmarchaeota archaeon]|nr:ornithine carbamoyltransferase [Candidatus Aenigmarchaeota archaeon]